MKRVAFLLGMGVLLIGSAVWAQDDLDMPRPTHLQPVSVSHAPVAVAAAPGCCSPSAGCCPAACGEHGHSASICDWLMYHPPHTHCACPCVISTCYPPLHLWFVDMCREGCGAHCHQAAAYCADGGCKSAPCVNKVWHNAPCADKGCSSRFSLLDWLGLED